ncbi:MAG: hypothetical protein IKE55_09855 [Kiritimatiellae bacterium]|nr:hypothetical protein [Kiritimatiellia bacterium]
MKKSVFAASLLAAATVAHAALPKVLVMVDEKVLGSISISEIETMAVKELGDKGIETVDRNKVQQNLERVQKAIRGAGDNRAAAALGREFDADVVLIGEAVSKPNAAKVGESNLRSYMVSVSFRAVRADNAESMASASETATIIATDDVDGSSRALRTAGGDALKKVVGEMVKKWLAAGSSSSGDGTPHELEMTVGGLDKVWKLREIRLRLKSLRKEVESVSQKSYAQGVATFVVTSLVSAEELAGTLVVNPPEDLKVQVVEIRETALSLRVVEVPKGDAGGQ